MFGSTYETWTIALIRPGAGYLNELLTRHTNQNAGVSRRWLKIGTHASALHECCISAFSKATSLGSTACSTILFREARPGFEPEDVRWLRFLRTCHESTNATAPSTRQQMPKALPPRASKSWLRLERLLNRAANTTLFEDPSQYMQSSSSTAIKDLHFPKCMSKTQEIRSLSCVPKLPRPPTVKDQKFELG